MKKVKHKSHKGILKRIKITKSGKILHRRSGKRHLMSGKSGKKVRQLRGWVEIPDCEYRVLRRQYNVI